MPPSGVLDYDGLGSHRRAGAVSLPGPETRRYRSATSGGRQGPTRLAEGKMFLAIQLSEPPLSCRAARFVFGSPGRIALAAHERHGFGRLSPVWVRTALTSSYDMLEYVDPHGPRPRISLQLVRKLEEALLERNRASPERTARATPYQNLVSQTRHTYRNLLITSKRRCVGVARTH
jgi:hypothetical protein